MRATEFIRNVLDLIDQIDCAHTEPEQQDDQKDTPLNQTGVDTNRFHQIFDMLTAEKDGVYDNSPNVVVAGIESVTTNAGGGWNGPKHPADIRADSVAMYPNHLHKPE